MALTTSALLRQSLNEGQGHARTAVAHSKVIEFMKEFYLSAKHNNAPPSRVQLARAWAEDIGRQQWLQSHGTPVEQEAVAKLMTRMGLVEKDYIVTCKEWCNSLIREIDWVSETHAWKAETKSLASAGSAVAARAPQRHESTRSDGVSMVSEGDPAVSPSRCIGVCTPQAESRRVSPSSRKGADPADTTKPVVPARHLSPGEPAPVQYKGQTRSPMSFPTPPPATSLNVGTPAADSLSHRSLRTPPLTADPSKERLPPPDFEPTPHSEPLDPIHRSIASPRSNVGSVTSPRSNVDGAKHARLIQSVQDMLLQMDAALRAGTGNTAPYIGRGRNAVQALIDELNALRRMHVQLQERHQRVQKERAMILQKEAAIEREMKQKEWEFECAKDELAGEVHALQQKVDQLTEGMTDLKVELAQQIARNNELEEEREAMQVHVRMREMQAKDIEEQRDTLLAERNRVEDLVGEVWQERLAEVEKERVESEERLRELHRQQLADFSEQMATQWDALKGDQVVSLQDTEETCRGLLEGAFSADLQLIAAMATTERALFSARAKLAEREEAVADLEREGLAAAEKNDVLREQVDQLTKELERARERARDEEEALRHQLHEQKAELTAALNSTRDELQNAERESKRMRDQVAGLEEQVKWEKSHNASLREQAEEREAQLKRDAEARIKQIDNDMTTTIAELRAEMDRRYKEMKEEEAAQEARIKKSAEQRVAMLEEELQRQQAAAEKRLQEHERVAAEMEERVKAEAARRVQALEEEHGFVVGRMSRRVQELEGDLEGAAAKLASELEKKQKEAEEDRVQMETQMKDEIDRLRALNYELEEEKRAQQEAMKNGDVTPAALQLVKKELEQERTLRKKLEDEAEQNENSRLLHARETQQRMQALEEEATTAKVQLESLQLQKNELQHLVSSMQGAGDELDELHRALTDRDRQIELLKQQIQRQAEELELLRSQLMKHHGSAHAQRMLHSILLEQEEDRASIERQEKRGQKYLERYWRRIEMPFGMEGSLQLKVKGPSKADPEPAVIVSEVVRDGPAHRAGLQAGNLIVKVRTPRGTFPIVTRADFLHAIGPRAHVFECVELSLYVVKDEKFIAEWKRKLLEAVKAERLLQASGSWYGNRRGKAAAAKGTPGTPRSIGPVSSTTGLRFKFYPPSHLIREVRLRMGKMGEDARRNRINHIRALGMSRFGPEFSPENVFSMQSNPPQWRTLVLAACDQCQIAGSREMILKNQVVDIVKILAGLLGSPPPPEDAILEAFDLVDIEMRGEVDFDELTHFIRELFMDVVFRDTFSQEEMEPDA